MNLLPVDRNTYVVSPTTLGPFMTSVVCYAVANVIRVASKLVETCFSIVGSAVLRSGEALSCLFPHLVPRESAAA
jgi:hypothetical protein